MGLLTGFTTILAVIACGAALAHVRVLDLRSQRTLAEVAFFVATPALMVVTIRDVHIGGAAANLAASAISLGVSASIFGVLARWRWRLERGEVLIGMLSSSYVNAGNLGIAIAAYVVGNVAVVVPTLLVQMLVVQPLALMVLDRITAGRAGLRRIARGLVSNPITLAALAGVVLALTGWELPAIVDAPLKMLSGAAIPLMLLSYGAALRLSPAIGRSGHNREVATVFVLKLALMPTVAWAVAVTLGVSGPVLLGVVMTAALPTAQNIFLHATRYRVGEDISRESILATTVWSLPVALLVAVLLG